MRRRIVIVAVVSLLLTLLAGASRIAQAYAAEILGRYPGAVAVAAEGLDLGRTQRNALTRQGEYYTTDSLADVQRWYVARLKLSPASDNYFGGECIWLTSSQLVYRVTHNVSVLLCARPDGTQVVVNESFALWP